MQFLYQLMFHLKIEKCSKSFKEYYFDLWPHSQDGLIRGFGDALGRCVAVGVKKSKEKFPLWWEPSMCINCSSLGVRGYTDQRLFGRTKY